MIHLVDASGLLAFPDLVAPDDHHELWSALTEDVEEGRLRLSAEVRDELKTIARDESVSVWATGLGSEVRKNNSNILYLRPLMAIARGMGFDEGFVTLDGHEPSIVGIGKIALEYDETQIGFCVVSADRGTQPLCPTMEQLCAVTGWTLKPPGDALSDLGHGSLLK